MLFRFWFFFLILSQREGCYWQVSATKPCDYHQETGWQGGNPERCAGESDGFWEWENESLLVHANDLMGELIDLGREKWQCFVDENISVMLRGMMKASAGCKRIGAGSQVPSFFAAPHVCEPAWENQLVNRIFLLVCISMRTVLKNVSLNRGFVFDRPVTRSRIWAIVKQLDVKVHSIKQNTAETPGKWNSESERGS